MEPILYLQGIRSHQQTRSSPAICRSIDADPPHPYHCNVNHCRNHDLRPNYMFATTLVAMIQQAMCSTSHKLRAAYGWRSQEIQAYLWALPSSSATEYDYIGIVPYNLMGNSKRAFLSSSLELALYQGTRRRFPLQTRYSLPESWP
jgi:hypothetical protein